MAVPTSLSFVAFNSRNLLSSAAVVLVLVLE
jgi:hypothetical protein